MSDTIWIDAPTVEALKNEDCLSVDAIIFRNGGTVNGKGAVPYVPLPALREAREEAARLKGEYDILRRTAVGDISKTLHETGNLKDE